MACISTSTDHPGCKGSRGVVRVSWNILSLKVDFQPSLHVSRWETTGQPWRWGLTPHQSCQAQSSVSLALKILGFNCRKPSSHGCAILFWNTVMHYHVLSLTLIFHPRSQSEECLSSCCPLDQLAWNCARKEKTVRGNPIMSFFSRHKVWTSIFSQFPSSWGRQEDNFGQIHQIRQQQQQYAWPCPQLSFSLGCLDPIPPCTGNGEAGGELSYSCGENARKFCPDLPLPACDAIVTKVLERAVWMKSWG